MSKTARLAACSLLAVGACLNCPAAADTPASFMPPNDGYDWIQLTSGEWLNGEFIGLFEDEVEFDSEVLDDLKIDWDDVAQLISPRDFGVSIQGQELLAGIVSVDGQRLLVISGGTERDFQREDLVAITAAAERELDRWSLDMSLGMNVRQGNAEFIETNITAGAERLSPRSRAIIDYLGSFNETEGERVANNHRLNGVLDRFSGSRLFWRPVTAQYFRDPFQNIAHQGTIETGLGYELISTNKTDWDVHAAAGVNFVRRDSVEAGESNDSTSPALTLGTDFETVFTSWIDYLLSFQMTFLDDESGAYQHHLVSTLSTDLIGDIDFDVSLVWDRTEKPPPDVDGIVPEQDDFRLSVGVGFEF